MRRLALGHLGWKPRLWALARSDWVGAAVLKNLCDLGTRDVTAATTPSLTEAPAPRAPLSESKSFPRLTHVCLDSVC